MTHIFRCQWPTGQSNDHIDFDDEQQALDHATAMARCGHESVVFEVEVEEVSA